MAIRLKAVALAIGLTVGLAACGGDPSPAPATVTLQCSSGSPYVGSAPMVEQVPLDVPAPADATTTSMAVPAELAARLDRRVADLLTSTGLPGVTAALRLPGIGHWSTTQGSARTTPLLRADNMTLFQWASVSKALTAVLVLQLVDEGRLKEDDRLAQWFPQMPQASLITIDQLLTHTSGLATNPRDSERGSAASSMSSMSEEVAAAARTPILFCPGTNASYSNMAYLMLGLIVEAIEQQPYAEVLQRRIAGPLGLHHLRALAPGEDAPGDVATPHRGQVPTIEAGVSRRLGSGNVVASAADVATVWEAVLQGRLLMPSTVRRQWQVLYPIADGQATPYGFGRGVMKIGWSDTEGRSRTWLGHLGGTPGGSAVMAYDPVAGAFVTAATNSEISAAAVATALLDTWMTWRSGR